MGDRVGSAFVVPARRFCEFVERAAELPLKERLTTAQRLLLELYLSALDLPYVEPPEGHDAGPISAVSLDSADFGEFDFYGEIFDPYEEGEPVMGHLADDVVDIRNDLRRGLELWDRGAPPEAAVWEWRFSFDTHWGDHAADALRALHWALQRANGR